MQHSGRVWLFSESRRLLSLHQNGKHGKKINNKRRAQRGRHSQVWFRRNVLWDSCQKVLQSSCSLKKRFFLHDLERTLTSSPPSSRNCRSASPSKPGERGGTQTRRGVRWQILVAWAKGGVWYWNSSWTQPAWHGQVSKTRIVSGAVRQVNHTIEKSWMSQIFKDFKATVTPAEQIKAADWWWKRC